jgi:hypothetical protein
MSKLNTPAAGRFDDQLDRLGHFMRLGQLLSQPPVGGDAAEGGEFIVPMPFSDVSGGVEVRREDFLELAAKDYSESETPQECQEPPS